MLYINACIYLEADVKDGVYKQRGITHVDEVYFIKMKTLQEFIHMPYVN